MTFELFRRRAMLGELPPGWRRGQYAFNLLDHVRPDISEQVRGHYGIDPFYRNDFLPGFFAIVEAEW